LRDGVAVKRAGTQDAEDEENECTRRHIVFRHRYNRARLPMPRELCQGKIPIAGSMSSA
jgi:hypothetical protein